MAAHVLRRFGFKKSEPRESEARIKLQKELFAFNKVGRLSHVMSCSGFHRMDMVHDSMARKAHHY